MGRSSHDRRVEHQRAQDFLKHVVQAAEGAFKGGDDMTMVIMFQPRSDVPPVSTLRGDALKVVGIVNHFGPIIVEAAGSTYGDMKATGLEKKDEGPQFPPFVQGLN